MKRDIFDLLGSYTEESVELTGDTPLSASRIRKLTMAGIGQNSRGERPERGGRNIIRSTFSRSLLIAAVVGSLCCLTVFAIVYSLRDAARADMGVSTAKPIPEWTEYEDGGSTDGEAEGTHASLLATMCSGQQVYAYFEVSPVPEEIAAAIHSGSTSPLYEWDLSGISASGCGYFVEQTGYDAEMQTALVKVSLRGEELATVEQLELELVLTQNLKEVQTYGAVMIPVKRNGQIIYSYKPLPYAEDAIYRQISDITISMKSTDHLQMPELVNSEYTVQLSDEERKHYDELKRELVLTLGDGEITAANAASLSGKLSQMANGAIYDDNGEVIQIHDRKLDALEDIIEAANGKPILVAYWFKHDLTRISERLKKLHIPFSRLDDSDSIRRWNSGQIPVALIHPASAGHGLNLQSGGSTLVWFGLTWSLELYQQTAARLWRQGQTSETVVVQHIVTKGTIDNRIMKALSQKEHTQTALIDAVKADLKI